MNKYILITAIFLTIILLVFLIPMIIDNPRTCKDFKNRNDILKAFNSGLVNLDRDRDGIPCENKK